MGRIKEDNLGEKALQSATDSHTADGGIPVPSGSLKSKLIKTFSTPSSWVRHGYNPVNQGSKGWTDNPGRPGRRNNPQNDAIFLVIFRSKIKSMKKGMGSHKESQSRKVLEFISVCGVFPMSKED